MSRISCGLVVIVLGYVAGPCWAASKDWIDGTGNWSVGANWTPSAVPGVGESVNIVFADDVAHTVTYDYTGPTVTLGALNVDMPIAGTNAITLAMAANVLTTNGGVRIGANGRGTFNQSGGTNTIIGNDLNLGNGGSGLGTYNLSGSGALAAGTNETIGVNGTGNFTQSGGTNTISGAGHELYLGQALGTGTYTLTGGSLTAGENEHVGYGGIGIFDHSAGTNAVANALNIGSLGGSMGTYTLSGTGQLTVLNQTYVGDLGSGTFNQNASTSALNSFGLWIGNAAGSIGAFNLSAGSITSNFAVVGNAGSGSFTQNGGVNTLSGLEIGDSLAGLGTYTMSAGFLTVNGGELVGENATGNGSQSGGTFQQTGGTHKVNSLIVGDNAGTTGTFTLGSGSLVSTAGESIGNFGAGSFSQSSGIHTSTGDVNVGANPGSSGAFSMSGGSASAANMFVGGRLSGAGGAGTLTVSGSSTVLSVPGTITVYSTPGSVLNLQSFGTLNVGGINVNGVTSLFNWSSGTLNITNDVAWDSGGAVNSTSVIFGSSLSLTSSRTLKVTGNETIGGNGPFNLTLLSGATHTVTGNMTLKSGSSLTVNSGSTLNYGSFTQAGGIIQGSIFRNATSFTYQNGTIQAQFVNAGSVTFGNSWTIGGILQNESTMTVSSNQTLTATSGITNLGNFIVNGGTIGQSSSFTNSIGGTLTAHGTINPTLTNHGTVVVDGVLSLGVSLNNDGIIQGAGTVNLISTFFNNAGGVINATNPGGTLSFTNLVNSAGSAVNVGPSSTLSITGNWTNSGIVNLQGSGSRLTGGIFTNNGIIQGFGTIAATMATSNTGVFRVSGGELDFTALGVTNSNQSQFQILAGCTAMFLQGMSNNFGTISLTGGALDNNGRTLTNNGTINGYGTLRTGGLTNNSGRLISVGEGNMDVLGSVVNNGVFSIQSGRSAYFFGAVSGSGSFTGTGTAVFLASLSPGNSPAQVNFAGGATLGGGTSLVMELGGSTVGTGYDKIDVEGQLSLGGVLSVSLINGFTPAAWSSFDLLDWGSLAGTFSSLSLPTLPVGQWDTSKLYVDGTLSVTLLGDFDHSGVVNAADYVVWRKGLGTIYFPSDYDLWRAHYGEGGSGSGSGSAASGAGVPEPGSILLAFVGIGAAVMARRRTRGEG